MKHNKRRNVGIVYEMLVRCVSESMLEGNRPVASSAMRVLKKYFGEGQPLARELAIHRAIMSNRGVSVSLARKIIAESMREAIELDRKLCDIKKSNLIKELNYGFGQNFFDRYRIPEYRALASAHLLIQSAGQARTLNEKVDRAALEESVVRFMCSRPQAKTITISEDRDGLALRLAIKEFQKVFGKSLLPEQGALLESFNLASMGGDRRGFKTLAERIRSEAVDSISRYLRQEDCQNDKILSERVSKVLESLKGLKVDVNEACLEDLMNAQGLRKEMEAE